MHVWACLFGGWTNLNGFGCHFGFPVRPPKKGAQKRPTHIRHSNVQHIQVYMERASQKERERERLTVLDLGLLKSFGRFCPEKILPGAVNATPNLHQRLGWHDKS